MTRLAAALLIALCLPAHAIDIDMCKQGRPRITCVVDGDTLWLDGQKLRVRGYDTPEPQLQVCGGTFERELAKQASARFLALLNSDTVVFDVGGYESKSSNRRLVDIYVNGRNVGEILVEERLARRWPEGEEWWCEGK